MTSRPPRHDHAARRLGAEPRLNARTEELVAARIADGSLPPGTPLLESRIAATLGTSRGPARQALEALAARGLVRRAQG
ncbi:GntR family transcriptional regulator, partial [Elioraea rosea]|uniref:GntR family transcriptional regulator n=1 Tax=Elioraea rosea TaxID=2492390 RepID=UPI0011859ADC